MLVDGIVLGACLGASGGILVGFWLGIMHANERLSRAKALIDRANATFDRAITKYDAMMARMDG